MAIFLEELAGQTTRVATCSDPNWEVLAGQTTRVATCSDPNIMLARWSHAQARPHASPVRA